MTATTRGLAFAGCPDPLQKGDHPSDTPGSCGPPHSPCHPHRCCPSAQLMCSTHLSVDPPRQEGKLSGWRACNVPTRNLVCSQSPGCLFVLWIIHSFHKPAETRLRARYAKLLSQVRRTGKRPRTADEKAAGKRGHTLSGRACTSSQRG